MQVETTVKSNLSTSSFSSSKKQSDRVERLTKIGKRPFVLKIAEPGDFAAIDRLRIDAYAQAGYFKIPDPELVKTKSDPDNSFCYIVTDGLDIAATMRLAFVSTRAEGAKIIEGRPPENAVDFPGVALCRGATNKSFRGMGLMTFLVSVGVSVARHAGLRSAIAMQAVGTPHFGAMQRAGWQSVNVSTETAYAVSFDTGEMNLVYLSSAGLVSSDEYSRREHADIADHLRISDAIAEGVRRAPVGIQRVEKGGGYF